MTFEMNTDGLFKNEQSAVLQVAVISNMLTSCGG
jgi:hypothetical protein